MTKDERIQAIERILGKENSWTKCGLTDCATTIEEAIGVDEELVANTICEIQTFGKCCLPDMTESSRRKMLLLGKAISTNKEVIKIE